MAGDHTRPIPRLLAVGEMQERNRIAAEKETREMREDCIAYLGMVASQHGSDGLRALFAEAIPAWAGMAGATMTAEARG